MAGKRKWTKADIGDQGGRVAVITGANTGLGLETARGLAEHGAQVVLAVRDVDRGKRAAAAIAQTAPEAKVTVQRLDLGSLDSVRAAAEQIADATPRIDLLINNAGLMYPPKGNTDDGFELQFGTNHLGHFALTALLLDNVTAVPDSRIVVVSSIAHNISASIHFDDLQWERSYNRVAAYGQSKLANLMFAYTLARRLDAADTSTIVVAAHPGISNTELTRHIPGAGLPGASTVIGMFTNSAATGALATLRAATDPDATNGQYYGPDGIGELRGHPKAVSSSRQSRDQDTQQRLWTVSEELTGVSFG